MSPQTVVIDHAGRITLPKSALDALGVRPDEEVTLLLTDEGLVIKPKRAAVPITERIAAMNLPVADWETMEQEIEAGRLG
jgi:AbrB family looped-hinge helix DNA binding protein